jgi:hypothetical protein
MTTLMMEYRQRHNKNFILPAQAGLLFFNKEVTGWCKDHSRPRSQCFFCKTETTEYQPALIVTTNLQGQASTTCNKCGQIYPGVILELFVPAISERSWERFKHFHIAPDVNIIKALNIELVPFSTKKPRDLEVWLWKWYLLHREMSNTQSIAWNKYLSKQKNEDLENMAWCAMKMPSFYSSYQNLCQFFLLGRKYLL